MDAIEMHARMLAAGTLWGGGARQVHLGNDRFVLEGLDDELTGILQHRWGDYLRPQVDAGDTRLRVCRGGPEPWLDRVVPGELYRLEALGESERRVIASNYFALRRVEGTLWQLVITEQSEEPLGRIVENALRIVTAHHAIGRGGFAMHAAGVLHDGAAYLFAGKSRSGKTTLVRLAAPSPSLGDDFAIVLREGDRWVAPALPFDNEEQITEAAREGLFEVAGVWRLHQADHVRTEHPAGALAVASLTACLAFPWLFPELGRQQLEHVQAYVESGSFAHLHFSRDTDLWNHLAPK